MNIPPKPLTEKELEEVLQLLKNATPKEWKDIFLDDDVIAIKRREDSLPDGYRDKYDKLTGYDSDVICALRNKAESMIAELKRLRAGQTREKILRDTFREVVNDLDGAKFEDFDEKGFDIWVGLVLADIGRGLKQADEIKDEESLGGGPSVKEASNRVSKPSNRSSVDTELHPNDSVVKAEPVITHTNSHGLIKVGPGENKKGELIARLKLHRSVQHPNMDYVPGCVTCEIGSQLKEIWGIE